MDEDFSRRRRSSGVLDAIFEAVEEKPEVSGDSSSPFRAAALARLNVPEQVDKLLPLVTRRTWIAVVGILLVIVAFLGYAAVTTTVTQVSAAGRVVTSNGVTHAVSPVAGVITSVVVDEGDAVGPGEVVASGVDAAGGTFEVTAPLAGTVWQELVLAGGVVAPGSTVVTILPEGSATSVLVALPEGDAAMVASALRVDLTSAVGGAVTGTVTSVSDAPVPVDIAATRTALSPVSDNQAAMIVVTPDEPLVAGTEVGVAFVLSESTLLQGILGGG